MKKRKANRKDLMIMQTLLASERTMLAQIRTSFASFALGIALVQFFEEPLIVGLGWLAIAAGIGFLVVGIITYSLRKKHISF